MNVVCFANNLVGLEAIRHLRESNADIVALVVHDPDKQKLGSEIIDASGVLEQNVIFASRLNEASTIEQIASLKPDCGVSAFFGEIIRQPIIDLFPNGIVNLHTSLLPLNRGSWRSYWDLRQSWYSPSLVSEYLYYCWYVLRQCRWNYFKTSLKHSII